MESVRLWRDIRKQLIVGQYKNAYSNLWSRKIWLLCGKKLEESKQYVGKIIFIDNGIKNNIGFRTERICVDINLFNKEWRDRTEAVIICAMDYRNRQEMVKSLLSIDYRNIFIADNYIFQGKLSVLNASDNYVSLIRKVEDTKPVLEYVEYHVTDYCNLKCNSCAHHSNEVNKLTYASLDTFKNAVDGLSVRFDNIETFRLMGGEPLLAENIEKYAVIIIETFPRSKVKIVTNGLIVTQLTERTRRFLRRHFGSVEVQVTQYPPTRTIAEDIVYFCEQNMICLSISSPKEVFNVYHDENLLQNTHEFTYSKWTNCGIKKCHFLEGNKLYYCTECWVQNTFYHHSSVGEYCFDIVNGNEDEWDIIQAIESPFDLCGYCFLECQKKPWGARTI